MPLPNVSRRTALGMLGTGVFMAACSGPQLPQMDASDNATPVMTRASTGDRVADIMAAMSTTQKVEQLIMPSLRYASQGADGSMLGLTELPNEAADALARHGFGGILLYGENLQANEQALRLTDAIQVANAPDEAVGRVPLLIATDQEGGNVHRLGNGCFMCGNMALGANGNEGDVQQAAALMGSELAALGINCDLAPDVDVNSNPENPIIGVRAFSDDPELVARLQASFVQGLRNQGIVSCAKHYPGHGDTDTDSHTGLPKVDVTLDELMERELVPFRAAAMGGVDMVLCAHIQFPRIENTQYASKDGSRITLPASCSQKLVSEVLRGELAYEGVVMTDSLVMGAIADHFDPIDMGRMAFEAGVDMLLEPIDPAQSIPSYLEALDAYVSSLVSLVEAGTIPEQTIDMAVRRVLTMKFNRGILDCRSNLQTLDERITQAHATVGSADHHALEHQIALRSVTLVQNGNYALPVQEDDEVLVLVPYESQVASVTYASGLVGPRPSVKVLCYDTIDDSQFAKSYETALGTSSVVVLVSTMYGTSDLNGMAASFIDNVLEQCASNGIRSVVISSQLPYDIARFSHADAILACYYGSGMTGVPTAYDGETVGWAPNLIAALCVALGAASPTATLPVEISEEGFALFERGTGEQY